MAVLLALILILICYVLAYQVLLFSHLVMSKSLRSHWLQHTRLLCAPLSPRVCSDSCPLSGWYYLTISFSAIPSPFALDLSHHQGLFQRVSSSHQVAKILVFQLQHQSFQWIFRIDFLQDWLVWSGYPRALKCLLQNHSLKASVLQGSAFFTVQLSHSYMTNGKTIALTIQTFIRTMMSLLFFF